MSQELPKSKNQRRCITQQLATNSSTNVDSISTDIGKISLSNNGGDIITSVGSGGGDGKCEMASSKKKGTSYEQKVDNDPLFQDPSPKEDCSICMLPMPYASGLCGVYVTYQPCCGTILCSGCMIAARDEISEGKLKNCCPFCRIPIHNTDKEFVKRLRKRMKLNDKEAFNYLGQAYRDGSEGLTKNLSKAHEMWNKAAELGACEAHYILGRAYFVGQGVKGDPKKGIYHMKLAAIGGDERARYVLGLIEEQNGSIARSTKHFMIGARSGHDKSLKKVGEGYKAGLATKDEYTTALRAYQSITNEMKSEQRSKAAVIYPAKGMSHS